MQLKPINQQVVAVLGASSGNSNPPKVEPQKHRWGTIGILLFLVIFVSFFAYRLEFVLGKTPSLDKIFTPVTQAVPQEVGSYDVYEIRD